MVTVCLLRGDGEDLFVDGDSDDNNYRHQSINYIHC